MKRHAELNCAFRAVLFVSSIGTSAHRMAEMFLRDVGFAVWNQDTRVSDCLSILYARNLWFCGVTLYWNSSCAFRHNISQMCTFQVSSCAFSQNMHQMCTFQVSKCAFSHNIGKTCTFQFCSCIPSRRWIDVHMLIIQLRIQLPHLIRYAHS